MSIDLPEADVVIQLAVAQGSRMQELQRIGRVQRPQKGKLKAYFHSLVTDSTEEMGYAERRRGSSCRLLPCSLSSSWLLLSLKEKVT
jgi:superfamily II DNA or RNA helicase